MPPQHSITAQIRYIRSEAFDLDKVKAERATMPDAGDQHPVVLYFAGESRYDIDAPYPVGDKVASAREYLKPDHGCHEWTPRRLRSIEAARCLDTGGKVGELMAFAAAVGGDRPLTDAQVDAYVEDHGLTAICDVGRAVLRASEAPKAAEKKP